ncbi:MAG TPA: hypothetical protein RMH99_00915, partial [Sandaracinaceae bacterium LLY-WYZ-13_1]|nr:hypothetical protein [Sandaracinaceae bacterium LLY-WYZ-13_1]
MDERLDEILERLTALENRVEEIAGRRGGEPDAAPDGEPSPEPAFACPFREEEQRIVDLVVRLVTEHVGREMDARIAELEHDGGGPWRRGGDGGSPGGPPPG